MEHTIYVCASGAFGIQSIRIYVNFGDREMRKSLKEIKDEIMSGCLMAGYTSILHYESIDGNKDAVTFLRMDNANVANAFIEKLDRMLNVRRELKDVETRNDEWAAQYGKQRIDFLKSLIREDELFMRFTNEAYRMIGIDVDDTETKRRVLENLGFYRTNV